MSGLCWILHDPCQCINAELIFYSVFNALGFTNRKHNLINTITVCAFFFLVRMFYKIKHLLVHVPAASLHFCQFFFVGEIGAFISQLFYLV